MSPPTRADPAGGSGVGTIETLAGGIDTDTIPAAEDTLDEVDAFLAEPSPPVDPPRNLWVARLVAAEESTRRSDGMLLADLESGHDLWWLADRVLRRADELDHAAATVREIGVELDDRLSRLATAPSLGRLRGVA